MQKLVYFFVLLIFSVSFFLYSPKSSAFKLCELFRKKITIVSPQPLSSFSLPDVTKSLGVRRFLGHQSKFPRGHEEYFESHGMWYDGIPIILVPTIQAARERDKQVEERNPLRKVIYVKAD